MVMVIWYPLAKGYIVIKCGNTCPLSTMQKSDGGDSVHACPPSAELSGGAVAHGLCAAAGLATPAAAASLLGGSTGVT